jgi:hypothetical protein
MALYLENEYPGLMYEALKFCMCDGMCSIGEADPERFIPDPDSF